MGFAKIHKYVTMTVEQRIDRLLRIGWGGDTVLYAKPQYTAEEGTHMLDDLTEKIQASQNKFEGLVSRIPGYAGYKQKEQRREADKLLRLHVARQYEEQLRRLGDVQYTLTMQGRLASIVTLERAAMRLQLLIDRIKTASYGYAGLFDALKVDEEALDKLYDSDQAMLDGVGRIAALLDKLAEAAQAEATTPAEANDLLTELAALNNTFSHRQDVIIS